MKKILAALTIAGLTWFCANAQQLQKKACRKGEGKVCRASSDKKTASCYNTHYAQSFEVCRNEHGYYICCETPGNNNTTYSVSRAAGITPENSTGEMAPASHLDTGAQPQMKACAKSPVKVCRPSANKKMTSCYNTHYAQSFQVCKNEHGYYICCETPNDNNTTYPVKKVTADNTAEGE
jgi:hypothetical protein